MLGNRGRDKDHDAADEVRWDYRTLTVVGDDGALLMAGREGWEAYAVHPLAQDGGYVYFLKRVKAGR